MGMKIYGPKDPIEEEKLPIVDESKAVEWEDDEWTPCDQLFS